MIHSILRVFYIWKEKKISIYFCSSAHIWLEINMFCALNVGDPSQSSKALVFLNNVKTNIINSVNNGLIIFERKLGFF